MENSAQTLQKFLDEVKQSQVLWGLQNKDNEEWVILESVQFADTDVMPVWSSQEKAERHCTEEWQDYVVEKISVSEWLEFWVEDLSQDNIIVGVNLMGEDGDLEMDLPEFSEKLAEIEVFS